MSRGNNNYITPEQCRAARSLLHISQRELAKIAEMGTRTIADYERGAARDLNLVTLKVLRLTLENLGIIFLDANGEGPGVRLKKRK